MKKKRVVITGLGILSPLGIGKKAFWKNLFAGKSGIKPITLFDTTKLKVKVGGEITDFDPHEILQEKRLIDLDRSTLLILSATKLCLEDAKLTINESNTNQTGVAVGTTFGNLHSMFKYNRESLTEGPRFANPSIFPSTVGNSPASRVAIKFKIKGFNTTIATGIGAGLDALEYATDFINLNRAEQILVGSLEDLTHQTFIGLHKLNYLSGTEDGKPISSPLDKNRNGIVFAEGATMFVLKSDENIENNSNTIYGEILGIGSAFDPARFYRYNPAGRGMKEAMRLALEDANLKPDDIDCILLNANSTRGADAIETLAIEEVFGDKGKGIPVTAIKCMTGESLSNSGGAAVAAAIGILKKERIPPTINLRKKDKNCELNCITTKNYKKKISRILVNSFSPNGKNTSMIIGRYKK
jgi:3-oxoacyl-[acyl-carrier-protein] synthase II